jgi:hypothetical protein
MRSSGTKEHRAFLGRIRVRGMNRELDSPLSMLEVGFILCEKERDVSRE